MESINYTELNEANREHLAPWLIVESVNMDVMTKDFNPSDMQVEFRINGVDLPFVATLQSIDEQLDKLISERAEKLLKDRLGDRWSESMDEAIEKFNLIQEDCVKKLRETIGIE